MRECLEYIYRRVNENPFMSEPELYEVLISSKFFRKLGYKKFGKDVRPQRVVPGERKKADYVCRDEYHNAVLVLEAKRPSHRTLGDALSQLWNRYVLPLKAKYGVLTNGWKFVVYKKIGENPERILTVDLSKISQKKCDELFHILKKPEYDMTLYSRVEEYFSSVEKLSLKTELAKEDFFETFKLKEDSVFGSLLTSLVELFDFVYPKSKFLRGAYGFWQRSLARKPKKIPDSWEPFLKEKRDIFRFMFCLESAHALLARLIVAKACEDLDFPGISVSGFALRKIHQVRGQIPLVAYPLVLISVIREMRDQLVYSLFEDDIFGWWRDGFTEFMEKSSGELLRESIDKRLEGFSEAAAKVIFMLYKFDFGEVAGDPLGDLYQQYFDKDTRKALGEFYTPVEVVNYILDAVGYENIGYRRLLDPACGSGTFIVEALKRYLTEAKRKAKKRGWAYVLRELCNNPRIVGFDIHPFACLIARTRFMLELIPYFKKALEEEAPRIFYLQRIPVFRTDSLAIETLPPEFQRQRELAETQEDIVFPVELPMKIDTERSISVSIILPSWGKIVSHGMLLFNLDEYFCTLQAIFDAVKKLLEVGAEQIPERSLKAYLQGYLADKDFERLANFFKPFADHILGEIKRIQSEFEDGRLIKSIEDTVLAALLKNYLHYDFVVGNPPYVRKERISTEYKENVLEPNYPEVYQGDNDLCVYFIARSIKWLSGKGTFGYIVSGKFAKARYGKYVRAFIPRKTKILQILDLRGSQVFRDATNDPIILILEKSTKHYFGDFSVARVLQDAKGEPDERIAKMIKHLETYVGKDYIDEYAWTFKVSQRTILDEIKTDRNGKKYADVWKIVPTKCSDVLKKIKQLNPVLSSLCKVSRGIETGRNRSKSGKPIFVFDEKTEEMALLERGILKPLVKGEDVRKWVTDHKDRWIVYTGNIRDENVLRKEYPMAFKHLHNHYEELVYKHKNGKNSHKEGRASELMKHREWYELRKPLDPDMLERTKILTRRITNEHLFAYDYEKLYPLETCCVISPKERTIAKLTGRDFVKFLTAVLNSTTMEFALKLTSRYLGKKGYEYEKQYLDQLPTKLPQTKKEIQLSKQIKEKAEKIVEHLRPKEQIASFPNAYVDKYRSLGQEFDEVEHVFNANYDELKPFISGLPDKGYVVYPNEGEDPIWVNTKEKAQYLALALRNRKMKQNDTIRILIPRDNSIVTEILEIVKKTIQEIKAAPIDQLEEGINELVYQLYSLNEDDKAVIEDFLKKF